MFTSPQSLSDAEIKAILSDIDLCGLYGLSLKAKAAFALKNYEADKEWNGFSSSLKRRNARRIGRWAAAAAIAAAIACAAFFNSSFKTPSSEPAIATINQIDGQKECIAQAISQEAEGISAEEAAEINAQYPVMPDKKKISAGQSHEPSLDALDALDETMALELARLDNELATSIAQTYIDQHCYAEYLHETDGDSEGFVLTDELLYLTAQ